MQGRFLDGVVARPHMVNIDLVDDSLWITADDSGLRQIWPLPDIHIIDAGKVNTKLGCYERGDARLTLSSADFVAQVQPLCASPHQKRSSLQVSPRLVMMLVLLAAIIVGGGLYVIPRLGEIIANAVPYSVEREWGKGIAGNFDRMGDKCVNPAGQQALKKIETALAATAVGRDLPIRLQVLDTGMVNAFALPGGHVRLLRGFIDQAESQDEVIGVLAHEIGHVAHRHALQGLVEATGLTLVLQMIGGGGLGGDIGTLLLQSGYSRDKEREADQFAVTMLNEAGLSGNGLIAFFDRLSKRTGHGQETADADANAHPEDGDETQPGEAANDDGVVTGFLSMLASHPAGPDRSAQISSASHYPASSRQILTDAEWQAFKNICD